mgnify:CR=1 FL=1
MTQTFRLPASRPAASISHLADDISAWTTPLCTTRAPLLGYAHPDAEARERWQADPGRSAFCADLRTALEDLQRLEGPTPLDAVIVTSPHFHPLSPHAREIDLTSAAPLVQDAATMWHGRCVAPDSPNKAPVLLINEMVVRGATGHPSDFVSTLAHEMAHARQMQGNRHIPPRPDSPANRLRFLFGRTAWAEGGATAREVRWIGPEIRLERIETTIRVALRSFGGAAAALPAEDAIDQAAASLGVAVGVLGGALSSLEASESEALRRRFDAAHACLFELAEQARPVLATGDQPPWEGLSDWTRPLCALDRLLDPAAFLPTPAGACLGRACATWTPETAADPDGV